MPRLCQQFILNVGRGPRASPMSTIHSKCRARSPCLAILVLTLFRFRSSKVTTQNCRTPEFLNILND